MTASVREYSMIGMAMPNSASIQALFAAGLPAGTKFFLVAAIPVEDPQSILSSDSGNAPDTTETNDAIDQAESAKLARLVRALQKVEPNDTRKVISGLAIGHHRRGLAAVRGNDCRDREGWCESHRSARSGAGGTARPLMAIQNPSSGGRLG